MIRMMIANPRPRASDDGTSNSANACPPNSISTPSADGMTARISSPMSTVSSNDASDGASNSAYAIRPASTPSDAICRSLPGVYGLASDCTPSISATSAKNGSITARTSGSSTPLSASNTMLPTWPAPCPPNWSSKMSMPRLLSTSGSVKSER